MSPSGRGRASRSRTPRRWRSASMEAGRGIERDWEMPMCGRRVKSFNAYGVAGRNGSRCAADLKGVFDVDAGGVRGFEFPLLSPLLAGQEAGRGLDSASVNLRHDGEKD